MAARIYKRAKSAMQSGEAGTKAWVLEHEPEAAIEIDPLMGWTSSRDMRRQVRLSFATKEDAILYAEREAIPYTVIDPSPRKPIAKSYADNFRFDRKVPWTH